MGTSTDTDALVNALNRALPMVARDALALSVAAGTLPGAEGVGLAGSLREMASAELQAVERLAARVASLGGTPSLVGEEPKLPKAWPAAVKRLLADGQATLEALVEAIPAKADDPEGEATEHLLEHIVARKRDDLELLERALR